jgi:hypothetical protein
MSEDIVWGNAVWTFLHVFAEKIHPEAYKRNVSSILQLIKMICSNLPCPTCSIHAQQFFYNVTEDSIKNVDLLKRMLHFFHNKVNQRIGKGQQSIDILNKYKTITMAAALIDFKIYYAKQYDSGLDFGFATNDKLRIRIMNNTIRWMRKNWGVFR